MTGKQIVLAVFIAVFLGVIGKSVWSKFQLRRKSRASLGWPLTQATIFRSSVTPKHKGEFGVVYGLEVWFTYLATGLRGIAQSEYQGVYREEFRYSQEAERTLESLNAGPFLVRYSPSAPADYFMDPYRDVRKTESSQYKAG